MLDILKKLISTSKALIDHANFPVRNYYQSACILFIIAFTHAVPSIALDMPQNSELDYTGKHWQCIRGYFQSGNQCRKVDTPENGELDYTGHRWQCQRGFTQTASSCKAISIPEHAELDYTGHKWQCQRGYRQAGDICLTVALPPNSEIDYSGHKWQCIRGYKQVGQSCEQVQIPDNAEIDYTGHSWKCIRGFKSEGGNCSKFNIPENASIDATGNSWMCNLNFKRIGKSCAPMTAKEITYQNLLIAQARACGKSYNYDVSGYCGGESVTGNVDACSNSKEVTGTVTFDNDAEMSFTGEWISKGEIEGRDGFGNNCDLDVD